MKKILALTLILMLCAAMSALADNMLYTTDNVNLRKGPGEKYARIGSLAKGTGVEYLGRVSTDKKGVDWYQVRYYGEAVWICAQYAYIDPEVLANSYIGEGYLDYSQEITAIPKATPQPVIAAVPTLDGDAMTSPTIGVPGMIEMSAFCNTSLKGSAVSLGLPGFEQGGARNMYYSDVLLISGDESTNHILVTGSGYTVYGVYVGMDINSARAVLNAAGLVQTSGGMGLYFQHPSALANPNGGEMIYDASVSAVTDGSGKVTEISWSAMATA